MTLTALEGAGLGPVAFKMLIAYGLGLPTGWERFKHDRSAGLRTFPLVSLASCAFLLVAVQPNPDVAAPSTTIACPLTNSESSLARNSAIAAISSGRPLRGYGWNALNSSVAVCSPPGMRL